MIRHLVTTGHTLTACGLMAAQPGSLVVRPSDVACKECRASLLRRGVCPECGEQALRWGTAPRIIGGGITETTFFLGCDFCSETLLAHVDPVTVAAYLTAQKWTP